MAVNHHNFNGLTQKEVLLSREKYGKNILESKKEYHFFNLILMLLKDPMVLLLLVAASIYFMSGEISDGYFLLGAVVFISGISIYQENRSKSALDNLKNMVQSKCKVIRNGEVQQIKYSELVIGDSLLVEEGTTVTGDGIIEFSTDFSVNESILTGESMPVFKDKIAENNSIYKGTTVATGMAIATISAIGNQTKLGKIGKGLEEITTEKSPLEIKINNFIKKMSLTGIIVFLLFWAYIYINSLQFLSSLLNALTLAMSIIPEEIPVAFTSFMALGTYRMMKEGIIIKQMKTVETLGSSTVICIDKTGTLTENKMSLAAVFSLQNNKITATESGFDTHEINLIETAMWASEPIPFDPMEKALHKAYENNSSVDKRTEFEMIHEYPLEGKPPLMTHIFKDRKEKKIIAVKGAPEGLLEVSSLSPEEKNNINTAFKKLALEGYRVLGIGKALFEGDEFPSNQREFQFNFCGLVAFYDPPKKNISKVLKDFYAAGISLKIITGDTTQTTLSIAKQIGFKDYENCITGEELMQLNQHEFQQKIKNVTVFTRMFPEAKLKIINGLKAENEIVAMTGDGVNDGPALKTAHIGIAMGKRGTEIAKQAASLILTEDDLSKMVFAIAAGRKIYANLKKAIQYIISIHIPLILTVVLPLVLGWKYPTVFSPIHIIFFEVIMGPTCAIIYENEPMEENVMQKKPRPISETFFNWDEISVSIIQGIAITMASLAMYQYSLYQNFTEDLTRTLVFTVLISSNIFLTLVNRSFYFSIFSILKIKNKLVWFIIITTVSLSALLIYVPQFSSFFKFQPLSIHQLFLSIDIGFLGVMWFEIFKWIKRMRLRKSDGYRQNS